MTSFVLYGRVAIAGRQDTGPSRDGQLARCVDYIESRGWAIVAEYADDTQGDAA
jgi:hypothetical protein